MVYYLINFNYNSSFKDLDGRMYFGSVKGLISFNPDKFIESTFNPPIYITGFQVNNEELAVGKEKSPLRKSIIYTDKITLKHDQSSFSIGFAALSYTTPESGNPHEAKLSIEILPPLWAAWWAYCLYLFIVIFIVVYLIKRYHQASEEKNERKGTFSG